jgi:membrane protease subunit HflK
MAWNEPGSNNRDPWGGGSKDRGPPDLDEVVRKLSKKFAGLFGSKGGEGGGREGRSFGPGSSGIWVIVAIIVIGWILSGIYIVDEGKRGVVLRFGRYVDTTLPGPHWRLPFPFESHGIVNVEERRAEEIGYRSGERAAHSRPEEALMLTQDENIVDIRLAVQYQIRNPRDYLFNVADPQVTLRQVIESATREIIGKSSMDFVLTEGRSEIVSDIKELSQKILDRYGTGLMLTNVNLQDAQPPEEVQVAFADAIKAREDEQRYKNEAEAYANAIIPKARGQAARRLQEAQAYRDQVIAKAEGETSRFEQILAEYQKAPEVTRERLYLETMEAVLSNTSKVLVDVKSGNNNLFYLPLDRLLKPHESARETVTPPPAEPAASATPGEENPVQLRDTSRSRSLR